ncbi:MAG: hypothetical protein MJH09_04915 [Cetobacterium sp.]|nr:hypothetical protein [Cetobacterium sp.]
MIFFIFNSLFGIETIENSILEENIIQKIKVISFLKEYKVYYSIDVFEKYLNIEIVFNEIDESKLNFNNLANNIIAIINTFNLNLISIQVVFILNSDIYGQKILFEEIYENSSIV